MVVTAESLQALAVFKTLEPNKLPKKYTLEYIIETYCYERDVIPGEIIFRKSDYGHSIFLVLEGECAKLDPEFAEQLQQQNNSYQRLKRNDPEQSVLVKLTAEAMPQAGDIYGVVTSGQLFGEIAALNRGMRATTAIALTAGKIFEITWPGLRVLLQFQPQFREQLFQLYRQHQNNLTQQSLPVLQKLSDVDRTTVMQNAQWLSFGQWTKKVSQVPEKIINQGDEITHVWLILTGFGIVTRKFADAEQTVAIINQDSVVALDLLAQQQNEYPYSIYAVGEVDILAIPKKDAEQYLLPVVDTNESCKLEQLTAEQINQMPAGFLDWLSEQRFFNGQFAMMIDLSKCVRCDACVNACADSHDGVSRFTRQGAKLGAFMVSHSCMHCYDPVCLSGCPTGAISRSAAGVVAINSEVCIGCGICAHKCSYDNITLKERRDSLGELILDAKDNVQKYASKCDACSSVGTKPQCVQACGHDAIARMDLSDLNGVWQWLTR